MNKLRDISEKITKLSLEKQNKNLRIFAKLNLDIKVEILKTQKKLFHKLRSEHNDYDINILTICSLIISIEQFLIKKNKFERRVISYRAKNEKKRIKRERLLNYWSIVKSLKLEQKMSFRQIAKFLAKYHKFQVSYSLIFQMWNELESKEGEEYAR